MSIETRLHAIEEYLKVFRSKHGQSDIIDYAYPIGCYFETSDANFNPNNVWSGTTWVLETEGIVHVSGGTNYAVSKANNASGAGEQDGGETTHTLTPSETAQKNHVHNAKHAHGITQTAHNHSVNNGGNVLRSEGAVDRFTVCTEHSGATRKSNFLHNDSTVVRYTISNNEANANISINENNFNTGNPTAGESNGSAHNNMQPYINVYRWHRTA